MANRTMLIAASAAPGGENDSSFESMGLGEFAYDVPLIYKVLASVRPRLCHSAVFGAPDLLAIAADAKEGRARLTALLNALPADAPSRGPIASALEFLSKPHNVYPVFLLEPAEVFDMSDTPLPAQMAALLEEIEALNLDSVAKVARGALEHHHWATDCWSNVLFFVPRGSVEPPKDFNTRSLQVSTQEVLENAATFSTVDGLRRLTLSTDGSAEGLEAALRVLQDVPADFGLNISGEAESLPECLGELRRLTWLNVCDLGLKTLPESIGNLRNVEIFSLARNPLDALPDGIGGMAKLEQLNLGQTAIAVLPESIQRLDRLEELDATKTRLEIWPEVISALPALSRLLLGETRIRALPENIGELRRLRSLNLAGLSLEHLPDALWTLRELAGLILDDNPLGPGFEKGTWRQLKGLKHVSLRRCRLSTFPEELCELPKLVRIDVRDNRMAVVSECIRTKRLEWIGLQGNPHAYQQSDFNAKAIGL
ncbi:MAG: leucine-rich repeat domain-containing protein [Myxococcota bacterium]